jgi:serine/threonine-protein kinase HipA
MAEQLQVCVNDNPAGELYREGNDFIFRYARAAQSEGFISLTMPVRVRDYVHNQLHPVFEMHLPEGYLLSVIKKHFAKLVSTDDFGILSLLSGSVRGRVQYKSEVNSPSLLSLDELLYPEKADLFDELVHRFALQSPLSGVQPKVLARVLNKATLKLDDYIVKAWGPEYPELALNEYWCMRVIKQAGIPVPEFYLSDDASLFIMKRFDVLADGQLLGFEDICVLQARGREDKYNGSYEQVAKTIGSFVSSQFKTSSYHQFFKMLVLTQLLQNGDAHLKNFGVIYEDVNQVRLAPAYDVLSTTAYIEKDMAALTMMGSRKWWPRKHLIRFGLDACGLSFKQANTLFDECIEALSVVAVEISVELEKAASSVKNNAQQAVLSHLLKLMKSGR